MLQENISTKRKERHKQTQEDFTPDNILNVMFEGMDEELYSDFSKTFCDPCMGNGNIYLYVLKKRLNYCKSSNDVNNALSTLYGVELMEDNVQETKERIFKLLDEMNVEYSRREAQEIMDHNLVCSDFFKWDFDNWKPIEEEKEPESIALF